MDSEIVWILANYAHIVQEQCVTRGTTLLQPAVRGRLAERLCATQGRAVERLTVMLRLTVMTVKW